MSAPFACRACGGRDVERVLSLGRLPLVNALVEPDSEEPDERYPLDVVRCRGCTLVQITETIPPDTLFRQYAYFSSYSDTMLDHARRFATAAVVELELDGDSLVVEAASNDGYLLRFFAERDVRVLGIEPARNVAEAARAQGIETVTEFLDEPLARRLVAERGTADLVVANNVLAHVPDLHGFVGALRALAGGRGRVVIEVPYLRDLVDGLAFDTIYHEHLSYFTVTSLKPVLDAHGLAIERVERHPVHGGSLRVHASAGVTAGDGVEGLLAEEEAWGVAGVRRFAEFAAAVDALRGELHELVASLGASGATTAAYGAAAKGVVLANVCGLDSTLVRFVVDRNPEKQGKLLPGVRIPVAAPEALVRERPDYCLLFAWNLAAEIVAQQAEYVERGGRFIAPVPTPRVLAA
jgi:hypothetical protein